MPRNTTTGVFTRTSNTFSQPVLGTIIDPSDADALFDDQDTGLSGLMPGKPNANTFPSVNDDSGDGYLRGSIWVNTVASLVSSRFYILYDNAAAAAEWHELGTIDPATGNLLFGTGNGASITSGLNNTFIGSSSGRECTVGNGNTTLGRGALKEDITGSDNIAVGHAAIFSGTNNLSCIGLGNSAGGGAQDGSEATIGFSGDSHCYAIGELAGKSTTAARTNCIAIGKDVAIGDVDNVVFIGRTCSATQVSGRLTQSGLNRATEATTSGVTLSATQIYSGFLVRSGAVGAPYNDTTPTAAAILAALTGAGVASIGLEAVSFFWICRNVSNDVQTLLGGSGVTVTGTAATAVNATATWLVRFTNTTTGTVACTFFRTDA